MKIMDDFCYEWKPLRVYHKIVMSKDEWDTKKGPDKSIKMHCMYNGMAKGRCKTVKKSGP